MITANVLIQAALTALNIVLYVLYGSAFSLAAGFFCGGMFISAVYMWAVDRNGL